MAISGVDKVRKKLLWGPGRRRVYEDVAACAAAPGGLFATR